MKSITPIAHPGLGILLVLSALLLPRGSDSREAPANWETIARGVDYRVVRLTRYRTATLHQVRVDLAQARLGLLYAPDFQARALAISEMVEKADAIAGINASYFDADDNPLGYLQEANRTLIPAVATGAAFTGIFRLAEGRAQVFHRRDFSPGHAQLVLQAGPRLIEGGQPVSGVHEGSRHRRSGIAIDSQGRVVLYTTGLASPLTMLEIQQALLLPEVQGGVGALSALNLDGGSSTQMFVRTPGVEAMVPGLTPVPVGIGVFRR